MLGGTDQYGTIGLQSNRTRRREATSRPSLIALVVGSIPYSAPICAVRGHPKAEEGVL